LTKREKYATIIAEDPFYQNRKVSYTTMDNATFESEYYTLTDEEGTEIEFEVIGKCEYKGVEYFAMIPAEVDTDAAECEYVILKKIIDDGEEMLVTLDDDNEFDDVADIFDDMFTSDLDYDLNPPTEKGKKK
jgi:uncharacterized protein YrzB (UPF0473 family)